MTGRWCKRMALTVAVLVTAVSGVQAFDDYAWTGNVNIFLGAKAMDQDDWEPAHEHGQVGLLVDFRRQFWPVNIAVDLLFSNGEGTVGGLDVEATTAELNVGVRKIWDHLSMIRPYVGGGLAMIYAEGTVSLAALSESVDDSSLGFWLNGGVYWALGETFNIGIDLRYSAADVTLMGEDVKAGGGHAGLILGWHW